jgi:hypothetical protein
MHAMSFNIFIQMKFNFQNQFIFPRVKAHHGVPNIDATMSILGVFLVHFKMQEIEKTTKTLK